MTVPTQDNQVQEKNNDKEFNFRALEQRYKAQLELERNARLEAERAVQEARNRSSNDDDDNDEDPYVDKKKLDKKLAKFGEQTKQQTASDIDYAVKSALKKERQNNWINQNKDFYEVLKHADKFAEHDPELAETILEMPEGFERQKLVYKNIKALGLHQERQPEPSIQQKIDANRRSPFYQPSSVGSSPYSPQGDFSKAGQEQAYKKMKELQDRMRI